MKSNLLVRLCHIYKCCHSILRSIDKYDDGDILGDSKEVKAILWDMGIIGEAAGLILKAHPEVISDHPEIPWSDMRRMRNRIMHGYDTINFTIVRQTIFEDLPLLLPKLKNIIKKINKSTGPA